MQLKKVVSFSAIVLSLLSVTHVEAGELKNSDKEMVCGQSAKPMRVTVRHIDPKGIGYNEGYTTVDGFFSLHNEWDKWRLFLDTRLHIFNSGRPALNAGLAARYVGNSRVWGGNAYYDYRKTHRYHYNQITLGFESLGEVWDFRLSGYAPVGRWSSHHYDVGFAKFKGHHALVRQKYEYALGGLNAEAAIHVVPSKNFPLYFAAGPYYLHGRGGTTWGGQGRASVWMYDYLKIEGNVSYDHLFKWIGQGQVSVTFSFGGTKEISRKGRDCATAERSYQPVDRFEIIATDKVRKASPAINPATGEPYFFAFVDNTSHSMGTYESPYSTLVDAQNNSNPGDIIYIFPGNNTTIGMDIGIVLQDNQKLWGSGVGHTFTTNLGFISIPAQTGQTPTITNADNTHNLGIGVTLATNNEISGLTIANTFSDAIYGTQPGNLSILSSSIEYVGSDYGVELYYENQNGSFLMDQVNMFSHNGTGLYLELDGSSAVTATISNSSFNNNNYHIYLDQFDESTLYTNITNNILNNARFSAIYIQQNQTSTQQLTITQNSFSENGYPITLYNHSTLYSTFDNNQFSNNEYPISIYGENNSVHTFSFTNNIVIGLDNGGYYAFDYEFSGETANVTVANNDFIKNHDRAYFYFANTGQSAITFTNNRFNQNSDDSGLGLDYLGSAPLNATFTNNAFSGNTDDGLDIYASAGADALYVTLDSNTFASNGGYGLSLLNNSGAATTFQATLSNNHFINNTNYGLYAEQDNASGTFCINMQNNTASGNNTGTDYFLNQITGTLNLSPVDASSVNSGTFGGTYTSVPSCE